MGTASALGALGEDVFMYGLVITGAILPVATPLSLTPGIISPKHGSSFILGCDR
jgi:hypothetical protein